MIYFNRIVQNENKKEHNKELHNAAYALLRKALDDEYNLKSRDLPEFIYNSYGKPSFKEFPELKFNISHTRGLAVCALHNVEMGIDAEYIRNYPERVLRRAFSERERQCITQSSRADSMFFRIWTLKESYVKALGIGISYPLNTAEFVIENEQISSFVSGEYHFKQILLGETYVCSLCLKGLGENSVMTLGNENQLFSITI